MWCCQAMFRRLNLWIRWSCWHSAAWRCLANQTCAADRLSPQTRHPSFSTDCPSPGTNIQLNSEHWYQYRNSDDIPENLGPLTPSVLLMPSTFKLYWPDTQLHPTHTSSASVGKQPLPIIVVYAFTTPYTSPICLGGMPRPVHTPPIEQLLDVTIGYVPVQTETTRHSLAIGGRSQRSHIF